MAPGLAKRGPSAPSCPLLARPAVISFVVLLSLHQVIRQVVQASRLPDRTGGTGGLNRDLKGDK